MRTRQRSLSLQGIISLCLLSGLLLSAAFPPLSIWPLAWIALAPWIAAMRGSSRLGAFLGSLLGGLVFFGALLSWMHLFGLSVWILSALLLGLGLALWGMFVRALSTVKPFFRLLGVPILWCGLEWARGQGAFGFTWGWLGYSQSLALPLLPLARYVGTLGLSFVIVLVNASLAELLSAAFRRASPGNALGRAILGCSLAVILLGVAKLRTASFVPPPTPPVKMAIIQGNEHGPLVPEDANTPLTPTEREQTLQAYDEGTAEAMRQRPVVVVWPESVLPGIVDQDQALSDRISSIVHRNNVWLVAGGPGLDSSGGTTNSAYLYSPTGLQHGRYDKVQLVPFGEYVPLRRYLPFLRYYHVRDFDFAAGSSHGVLQAGAVVTLGPMICFESTFPQIGWELARKGAHVLVVLTNDSWFGYTAAAAQHRQIAVLRAVETGRWVLRAASTGISSIIAPDGRIVEQAGLYQHRVLTADVPLLTAPTLSTRIGAAFGWIMFAGAALFALAPLTFRKKRRLRPSRNGTVQPLPSGPRRFPL